jgi:hypothetical protein
MRTTDWFVVGMVVLLNCPIASGQEEGLSRDEYVEAFAADFLGEWVSESQTDRDLPAVWKKGDTLVAHLKYEWANEGTMLKANWWAEVNGTATPTKAMALIGWDDSAKHIACNWYSTVGEKGTLSFTKSDDKWICHASAVQLGGLIASHVAINQFTDDGKLMSVRLSHRILNGTTLPDKVVNWKRQ